MNINFLSKIEDIKQAIGGTWALSREPETEWVCLEQGNLKIFKKLCQKGDNVLPEKFLKEREEITPYLAFTKNGVGGGIITLQDQYITLSDNSLVLIIRI